MPALTEFIETMQKALQKPEIFLRDNELINSIKSSNKIEEIIELEKGNYLITPKAISGSFGVVFHFISLNYAYKVFLKPNKELQNRYKKISDYLRYINLPYFVKFEYIENGLYLGNWYPALKMEWVKGETIDKFIEKNLYDINKLQILSNNFLKLLIDLKKYEIAHGDLHEGNIFINEKFNIILVDYDGMYIPPCKNDPSKEIGYENYQHPKRKTSDYGPYLDNFSGWVIYLSIIALIFNPSLWKSFNGGDKKLLFEKSDYQSPKDSEILKELDKINDNNFKNLLNKFKEILGYNDISQIPSIIDFVKPKIILPSTTKSTQTFSKLQQKNVPQQISYKTIKSFLYVVTTPPSALVFIDGSFKGLTPINIELDPGKHELIIKKTGYETNYSYFIINPNETKKFNIILYPEQSSIQITTQSPQTQIYSKQSTPQKSFQSNIKIYPRKKTNNAYIKLIITLILTLIIFLNMNSFTILFDKIYTNLFQIYNNIFLSKKESNIQEKTNEKTNNTQKNIIEKVKLISPETYAKFIIGNIEFIWSPVENANIYQFNLYDVKTNNLKITKTTNNTQLTIYIPEEGNYYWRVRAGNSYSNEWSEWSDNRIIIIENSVNIAKNFKINSNPSNADVWIDEKYFGKTPLIINISMVEHEIKISKEGYETYYNKFYPKPEGEIFINLNEISFDCPIKTIGLCREVYNQNPSKYIIEVKQLQRIFSQIPNIGWQENYQITGVFGYGTEALLRRFQKAYNLESNGIIDESTKNKLCELWNYLKVPLYINTNPENCDIYIDGDYYGITPLNIYLVPGNYWITIKKENYKTKNIPIKIEKNKPLNIDISLD